MEVNNLALETCAALGARAGGYHSTVIVSFPIYKPHVQSSPFKSYTIQTSVIYFEEVISSLSDCQKVNLGVNAAENYWRKDTPVGEGLNGYIPRRETPVVEFRGSCYDFNATGSNPRGAIRLDING